MSRTEQIENVLGRRMVRMILNRKIPYMCVPRCVAIGSVFRYLHACDLNIDIERVHVDCRFHMTVMIMMAALICIMGSF